MPCITLFIPSLGGGGAERVFVNLVKGFVQRGINVDMVLLRAKGPYLRSLPPQVRVFDLEAPLPFRWAKLRHHLRQRHAFSPRLDFSIKAYYTVFKLISYLRNPRLNFLLMCKIVNLKLINYLQQCKTNTVLSALPDCNLISLIGRYPDNRNIRLVISEHSTPSISWANNEIGSIWLKLARKLYPYSDAIVAVSRGVADDLCQLLGLNLNFVQVIYNPVVTPELFVKAQEPVDISWFEKDQTPVIISVGRLTKAKDFPTLLQAFALVRQVRPTKLLILGEGEERQKLEQLARKLGIQNDILMPGFVDNPFAFMARASVFVLSSAWEGFGNVIVEALACGCPVISTNCRSGPAEILDNGRYGRLVPVGDYEALAKAILETLEDPDKPADKETRIQRAMEFSVDAAVDKYLKVLLPNLDLAL